MAVFDKRWMAAGVFGFLVIESLAAPAPAAQSYVPANTQAAVPGSLSVMTYNVEGLPFPAALNRALPLEQIGLRLAGLRRQGRQPHVVLLQEAFIPQAKVIATLAGYPFVVAGPAPADLDPNAAKVMPEPYRAAAGWRAGETEGKWLDSGLVVMSDFPITRTISKAFAADACAGFDCLATKGVLLAWIRIPGQSAPVAIADTHLNSRAASGTPSVRANAAYAEQWGEAQRFIAAQVDPGTSLVFGGDFNIGHDPARIAPTRRVTGSGIQEATAMLATTMPARSLDADVRAVIDRGKDKQFFRSGSGKRLAPRKVEVPFGIGEGGYHLSDHLGFVVTYDTSPQGGTT